MSSKTAFIALTLLIALMAMAVDGVEVNAPIEANRQDQNDHPHAQQEDEVIDFESCTVCEWVMAVFKERSTVNKLTNPSDIFDSLEDICHTFPRTVEMQCEAFVGQNIEALISHLERGGVTGKFCRKEGLCIPKSKAYDESGTCPLCEWSVKTMAKELGLRPRDTFDDLVKKSVGNNLTNVTSPEIEKQEVEKKVVIALDSVRGILPNTVSKELNVLIDETGPLMIKLFVKEHVALADICTNCQLCDKLFHVAYVAGPQCVICQWIWRTHWTEFMNNDSDSPMVTTEATMGSMCNNVHETPLAAECQKFITENGMKLMDVVHNATLAKEKLTVFDGMRLCKKAKVCFELSSPENPECMFCDWMTVWLDQQGRKAAFEGTGTNAQTVGAKVKIMEDTLSSVQINEAEEGCNELPEEYRENCRDFVHMHLEDIRQAMGNERAKQLKSELTMEQLERPINSEDICRTTKMCSEETGENDGDGGNFQEIPEEYLSAEIGEGEQEPRGNECMLCHWMMSEYKQLKESSPTKNEASHPDMAVQQRLIDACAKLPESLHADCLNWVRSYAEEITSFDPDTRSASSFCELMDMCIIQQ